MTVLEKAQQHVERGIAWLDEQHQAEIKRLQGLIDQRDATILSLRAERDKWKQHCREAKQTSEQLGAQLSQPVTPAEEQWP